LADDDQKRITGQLAASLGKEVQITTQVNSELLGGLVIRVGDRVIDGSARQRLNALRGSLARGIV
jgi:F-type H+-transporting ATPase subunit delta